MISVIIPCYNEQETLPYENIERVAGGTKWNFWKLFRYAVDGIINFSQALLSIATWFGMDMTFKNKKTPAFYCC